MVIGQVAHQSAQEGLDAQQSSGLADTLIGLAGRARRRPDAECNVFASAQMPEKTVGGQHHGDAASSEPAMIGKLPIDRDAPGAR